MPYLEFLFCEECGSLSNLDIDYAGTIDRYMRDGRNDASIDQAVLVWDYLIYYCPVCGSRYEYTYREVERRVREYLVGASEKYRKYFKEKGISLSDINVPETIIKLGPEPRVADIQKHTAERVHALYAAKKE